VAIRPRTLGAATAPVLVGTALAHRAGAHDWTVAAACLGAALALQVAANLTNDALDFARGVDGAARLGPPRATHSGWLSYRAVLAGAALAVGVAAGLGSYLVAVAGWPILAIGLASIAGALAYSGGPWPLASHGLGEAAAFLFFGPLAIAGTTYAQTRSPSLAPWLAALPIGALVSCLMLVNNLRDIASDAAAGKRTLAVRLGATRSRALYAALVGLALLYPAGSALAGQPGALLACTSLPLAAPLLREVRDARDGPAFNRALAHTARLHAAYGALYAVGLAL
jgi:1,4-dihydroxy-2-naphthoate octaprenyltransferase